MTMAAVAYTHEGITIALGSEGEAMVAADTTVLRHGAVVASTTDHLLGPDLGALLVAAGSHVAALAGRAVTDTNAFVERLEGATIYHWMVRYAGEPVRLPAGGDGYQCVRGTTGGCDDLSLDGALRGRAGSLAGGRGQLRLAEESDDE